MDAGNICSFAQKKKKCETEAVSDLIGSEVNLDLDAVDDEDDDGYYSESDYYLWLGLEMLNTIENRTRTEYGFTIIADVVTGIKADYMPSYFLAETLKYLLLMFDESHIIHSL